MNYTLSSVLTTAAIFLFVLDWILDKDMNIKSNTISEYANGKYGYLTTMGFIMYGLGVIFFSGLLKHNEPSLWNKILVIALLIYGCLIALLSVFRCDKPGQNTWHAKVHSLLASSALAIVTIAMWYLFIWKLTEGIFLWATLLLAVINLMALLLFIITGSRLQGIWERVSMFAQYFWIVSMILILSY